MRLVEPKTVKAGGKVGPGKYICLDCGKEYELNAAEQDLRKCPSVPARSTSASR